MKVELDCRIIPVDSFGNSKDPHDSFRTKLYFDTVEEARAFTINNSDTILFNARITVEETGSHAE